MYGSFPKGKSAMQPASEEPPRDPAFAEWFMSLTHVLCTSIQLMCFLRVSFFETWNVSSLSVFLLTCHPINFELQEKKIKGIVPVWVQERLLTVVKKNDPSKIVISLGGEEMLPALSYDFSLGGFLPPSTQGDGFVGMVVRIECGKLQGNREKDSAYAGSILSSISLGIQHCIVASTQGLYLGKRKKRASVEGGGSDGGSSSSDGASP